MKIVPLEEEQALDETEQGSWGQVPSSPLGILDTYHVRFSSAQTDFAATRLLTR
jgi:hypothetical protein